MPKRQDELPAMDGPGVELPKDKLLDELGDAFTTLRDKKAKLATNISELEKKIIDRMALKGIKKYRFADQEVEVKESKLHVKIKTVKVDGVDNESQED